MPFPSGVTLVTVTGKVSGVPDGLPAAVKFTAANWAAGPAANALWPSFTRHAVIAADGTFSINLPATDDPAWTPVNWSYTVTLTYGDTTTTGTLTVPYAGGTFDLADRIDLGGTVTAGVTYMPLSLRSAAGGVAGLDVDGDVIDADGTKIVNGVPASTVVAETAYGAASAVGVATTRARGDHTHGTPALGTTGTTAAAGNHTHAYLPLTGGTVTGDVTVADNATATKAYRFKVSGGSLDLDAAGQDLYLSAYPNPDFTGTQRAYARYEAGTQLAHLLGRHLIAAAAFDGSGVADLDPSTGVAAIGAKNSLTNVRISGFKATAGAPTTGTWATGDVVLDSTGAWHLCTAGGTPGTWTAPAGGSTLVVKRAVVSSGNITPQNTAGAWAALTGGPTLVIAAAVGDYLTVEVMGLLMTKDNATFWDLALLNGASLVRFGSSGTGTPAAEGDGSFYPDTAFPRSGTVFDFVAASGDINGGNVTACFAVKSGGAGVLHAGFYPLRWRVLNHGAATVS